MSAPTSDPQSDRERMREEYAIARKYMGRVPFEMVAWGLGNFLLWVSLFPLVLLGVIPLQVGFLLACFCCAMAYLPSHEAQHSIIAAEGTRWRWLNELVGHVSTIPLVFPYRIAWITHRQHHAHANDPGLDPDYSTKAATWWQSTRGSLRERQPMKNEGYKRALERSDDPNVGRAVAEGALLNLAYYTILTVMAWSGHAIEAALLWVHHLFPKIPLFQTGPAYWEMRDLLIERGVHNDGL